MSSTDGQNVMEEINTVMNALFFIIPILGMLKFDRKLSTDLL